MRLILLISLLFFVLTGCAAYTVPGRGADMRAFGVADPGIESAMSKRPMAHFPCAVAVARVQDCGYRSPTATGWGTGRYSVVFTRDVEKDEQMERLEKLPQLSGIVPMNQLLLSADLQSDLQLRQAAAQLHADMLLVYTFDTTFNVEDKAAPLTVISLGLSPNKLARVNCTASAMLIDTRNAYVYGVAEASDHTTQLTSAWTSDDAVDDSRRRVETRAFEKLVAELGKTWTGVVGEYAQKTPG